MHFMRNTKEFIMKRIIFLAGIMTCWAAVAAAHDGPHSQVPIEACEKSLKSDLCEYRNGANDLFRGTCQVIGNGLRCVRNKPIKRSSEQSQANVDTASAER